MVNGVCGNHDIPDVDLISQGTGNTGVYHRIHLKIVHQDLRTDSSIHLADAALYHNHRLSVEQSLVEFHGCFFCHGNVCHHFL